MAETVAPMLIHFGFHKTGSTWLQQSLFGADSVCAIPFELLAKVQDSFAVSICEFYGRPLPDRFAVSRANRRCSLIMQKAQRAANFLFYHNQPSAGALIHIRRFHKRCARLRGLFDTISLPLFERWMDRRLRPEIDSAVGDYSAESNARTERLIGHSLGDLGYMTAA